MKKTNVFGIDFSEITINELAETILSGQLSSNMIVTPNVDHIVRYHKNKMFKDIYNKADIFVNDSRVLMKLSRLIDKPIENLIPGSDLTELIFSKLHDKNISICVIGANKHVIDKVCRRYNVDKIAHYNPPMGFDSNDLEMQKCIEFCKQSHAELFFLAVGSPRQEIVANALKEEGVKGCFLCIGASLLFLAGEEKRAPLIFQKLSIEWLYRLLQSPRRLAKRYLIDGLSIFPIVFKEKFRK